VPSYGDSDAKWASPSECLWDAPDDTISKYPIKALYTDAFGALGADMLVISGFFRETLAVPDMTWTYVIGELKALKQKPSASLDSIRRLYGRLHDTELDSEDMR
jgi:hypothetical protein